MKVINFFGGPGIGKSTVAAQIFVKLRKKGYQVELVGEFAKDLVYDHNYKTLANQAYIFGKQLQRMRKYIGHPVDILVADSPLPLSIIYRDPPCDSLNELVMHEFNRFDNINVVLKRDIVYNSIGRLQKTAEEAEKIDRLINDLMFKYQIPHMKTSALAPDFNRIFEKIA